MVRRYLDWLRWWGPTLATWAVCLFMLVGLVILQMQVRALRAQVATARGEITAVAEYATKGLGTCEMRHMFYEAIAFEQEADIAREHERISVVSERLDFTMLYLQLPVDGPTK